MMKITAELVIDVAEGSFAECITLLSSAGCEIQRTEIISRDNKKTRHTMDIIYSDSTLFKKCIATFGETEKISVIKVRNCLEDIISGGFVEVRNNMKIDTLADYEMNVLGVSRIAIEKILESDVPAASTSIWKNIGIITGFKAKTGQAKNQHYASYAESELLAAVLAKFTGKNGFPYILRYDFTEDFLKIISSLEPTFSAYRITQTDDDDNPDIYEQIKDSATIPVISKFNDELPIFMLAAILKMIRKHRFKMKDSTVGFIGLDVSSIRLSHICSRMEFMRVLGFDNNEKGMLNFERSGGLATIPEHIFGNSDILIIKKNQFSEADLSRVRPGMVLISLVDDDTVIEPFIRNKTCREIVSGEWADSSILVPGLLSGLLESGKLSLADTDIISLAELLADLEGENEKLFPSVFSDIHNRISATIIGKAK